MSALKSSLKKEQDTRFHSDDYQDKILVYFENDKTEKVKTFCFLEDGDNIANPDDYRYLGTETAGSRYLFEILKR
ncbi:MAG: hypothetical protein P0116_14615 [Candidatus Nitrosocosmicus sp.]|nr:hypothetical protein [Candidatus Nitrosocosmicus sp.]